MASRILPKFNDHMIEFIDDIQSVFPDDPDIHLARNIVIGLRSTNPRIMADIWHTYIVGKYEDKILSGDVEFFLNRDYADDVAVSQHAEKIMEVIDRLREPIRRMDETNKVKTMKYVQNLTQLSSLVKRGL